MHYKHSFKWFTESSKWPLPALFKTVMFVHKILKIGTATKVHSWQCSCCRIFDKQLNTHSHCFWPLAQKHDSFLMKFTWKQLYLGIISKMPARKVCLLQGPVWNQRNWLATPDVHKPALHPEPTAKPVRVTNMEKCGHTARDPSHHLNSEATGKLILHLEDSVVVT